MKTNILLLFFCFLVVKTQAQDYPRGMAFDDDAYKKVAVKAKLLTRDYTVLPSSASLKKYCPTPGSQKGGTCVGWSSAYAARTIVEAKQNGWTDKSTITANAFAGYYIYANIKRSDDYDCSWGSFIDDALQLMIDKGVPKHKDFKVPCSASIPGNIYSLAKKHKIQDYARLFGMDDSHSVKLQTLKKSLANGNPVVIGMKCPDSFGGEGYWKPTEDPGGSYGGHAMCVIGYDDSMYGGAFEVMNSWGTWWGNEGFIWIKYHDFTAFTKYAYEVIAIPQPSPNVTKKDLSGEVTFQLAAGEKMTPKYIGQKGNIGFYKMNKAYISGTKFRLYISNHEPAYVYAIGSDQTGEIFTIFPHKKGISAALNYQSNNIAIPDESHYIRMDKTVGKDYLCVFYSKKALDIEGIKSQLRQKNGSFTDRVNAVMQSKLVTTQNTDYESSQIKFAANSQGKSVVAVMVETEHQ